jgi:molybdate transport system substrate-binding protein
VRRIAAAALAAGALVLPGAGCAGESATGVRVFAASSLTGVMGALAADFEKETGTKVILNLASSSTLARQIVEGAPCDLFLSADEEWAAFVEGRIGPRYETPFLENRLVLVEGESGSSPGSLPGAPDRDRLRGWLLDPGVARIALGDPEHVPAGRYAKRALERADLWDGVKGKVVPADSVRSALALVLSGEVDGGIVYRTDALAEGGRLSVVAELPGVVAVYSLMMTDPEFEGPRRDLFEFLVGPRGRAAFESAGFTFLGDRALRR